MGSRLLLDRAEPKGSCYVNPMTKLRMIFFLGMGNSAVDIAVDVSRTAKKVFMSTRRGAWIISRMGPLGYPADALANSRCEFIPLP